MDWSRRKESSIVAFGFVLFLRLSLFSHVSRVYAKCKIACRGKDQELRWRQGTKVGLDMGGIFGTFSCLGDIHSGVQRYKEKKGKKRRKERLILG
jgi:hypothetical protein